MSCNHNDCNEKYFLRVFRIDGSTLWGFNIGTPDGEEMKILCTKGSYKTKREAEIVAGAFIAGMKFIEDSDSE